MLVPYKQYIGKSIEAALQKDPGLSTPADAQRLQKHPAASSRLLAAATEKNKQRREQRLPAISYRAVRKGGQE